MNKRVGGLEDLFQLVTNRLRDIKLEINNGICELCRSVNQLKLTVEPKPTREPELTTLKTLKFSIGVASDVQNMISQGTQYDERDFQQDSKKKKTLHQLTHRYLLMSLTQTNPEGLLKTPTWLPHQKVV